jgi:hypothetical protein
MSSTAFGRWSEVDPPGIGDESNSESDTNRPRSSGSVNSGACAPTAGAWVDAGKSAVQTKRHIRNSAHSAALIAVMPPTTKMRTDSAGPSSNARLMPMISSHAASPNNRRLTHGTSRVTGHLMRSAR